jgi:hypothetical protein
MPHFKEDSCYAASGKYCACIEFHLAEGRRRGFHTSQLIEYTLEANPGAPVTCSSSPPPVSNEPIPAPGNSVKLAPR